MLYFLFHEQKELLHYGRAAVAGEMEEAATSDHGAATWVRHGHYHQRHHAQQANHRSVGFLVRLVEYIWVKNSKEDMLR